MPGYRARPAEGERPPVVLVVQEIFGVHEYIRDVCRRLAVEGYLAVAPDLYRRHGDVSKLGQAVTGRTRGKGDRPACTSRRRERLGNAPRPLALALTALGPQAPKTKEESSAGGWPNRNAPGIEAEGPRPGEDGAWFTRARP